MDRPNQEQRRASAPHNHQHHQPRYPQPDTRPRSQTDGTTLKKVHSRPEDYRNKPLTGKPFEYICFDDTNHPQERDEDAQSLNRLDSTSSHESKISESDDDSEDDLSLPPTYHHDIAQQKHETPAKSPYAQARRSQQQHSKSPETKQQRSRNSSTGSAHSDELLAQVAQHLQAHRDAFTHGNGAEMVNELLGEVVRKVSDGALDPGLMKEVVREVQHVL